MTRFQPDPETGVQTADRSIGFGLDRPMVARDRAAPGELPINPSLEATEGRRMSGPTQGATENAKGSWAASPRLARLVRIGIFLAPLISAWLMIHLVGSVLYQPSGRGGLALWLIQAAAITISTALLTERWVSRFLPLATILGLSLTFPDQAPSRFGVALRAGTVKQLQARIAEMNDSGLDGDEAVAARQAIELVMLLGRHERLTRGHTERVRAYTDLIGVEMGLNEHDRSKLSWAALLHDIGKLTVPAEILNKDGRPTDEEWAILRNHPAAGEAYLEPLADWLGDWRFATSQHHERWDGKGYPRGLAGEEISLAGRIVAAADAYDVITSKRSYKAPMSSEAARRELVACAGSQFDPAVVRALLAVSMGKRRSTSMLAWLMQLPGASNVVGGVSALPTAALASVVGLGSVLSTAPVLDPAPPSELAFVSEMALDPSPVVGASTSPGAVDLANALEVDDGSGTDLASTAVADSSSEGRSPSGPTPTTASPTTSAPTIPGGSAPTVPLPTLTLPSFATTLPSLPIPTTTIPTTTAPTTTAPTTTTTTTTPGVGPTALADVAIAALGSSTNINVLANDLPGSSPLDVATLRIVSGPSRGSAVVSNGQIRYTGPNLLIGVTSLTYEICDTSARCSQATVVITILLA